MIIDESLNWSRPIQTVVSKIPRYIGIMYKIKKLGCKSTIISSSHILIISTFSGDSLVNQTLKHSSPGNKGGVAISGFITYKYRDGEIAVNTKPYFSEYKILTVHGIITLILREF